MTDRSWPIEKLGRTARIGNGSTPRRDSTIYWRGGDVPWLNSSVVNESRVTRTEQFVTAVALRECHLPVVTPGSVLVGLTGQGKTRGMATILDIEATLNQHVAYVTPDRSRWFPEYLLWSLRAAYDELRCLSEENGSTKGGLTCEALKQFRLAVPPLGEQHRIAAYLYEQTAKIDSLIEEQERLILMLRERRVATVTEALDGYEHIPLRRLVDHRRPMTYGILQCGEPIDGGVAYIGPSDILGEGMSPSRDVLRTTAPEIASAYQRSVLAGGDVVVSIGPAYGKVAVISDDLAGANLTQDTVRVALRPDLADTRFVVWALLSRQTAEYWDYQIMGATFRRLNLGTLARTPIPLPPIDEQRRIAHDLDKQTARIDTLIEETQRFIELARERRAALIAAAVTGQVDVREMA